MISRSRHVAGAYQNFNGSRDLITPLSGMVCDLWASTCHIQQPTKFEVSISTHYEDMMEHWRSNMQYEMLKTGWFGVVSGHSFDKAHTSSY